MAITITRSKNFCLKRCYNKSSSEMSDVADLHVAFSLYFRDHTISPYMYVHVHALCVIPPVFECTITKC